MATITIMRTTVVIQRKRHDPVGVTNGKLECMRRFIREANNDITQNLHKDSAELYRDYENAVAEALRTKSS